MRIPSLGVVHDEVPCLMDVLHRRRTSELRGEPVIQVKYSETSGRVLADGVSMSLFGHHSECTTVDVDHSESVACLWRGVDDVHFLKGMIPIGNILVDGQAIQDGSLPYPSRHARA